MDSAFDQSTLDLSTMAILAEDSPSFMNLDTVSCSNQNPGLSPSFWDISIHGLNHKSSNNQRITTSQNRLLERKFIEDSVENLLAILISVLRKHFKKNEKIDQFFTQISLFLLSKEYSILFEKYCRVVTEEYFDQIKSSFHPQDHSIFYHFRQNLYPSLIGSDGEECIRNLNQVKFDAAVKWLHGKYRDYLILQHQIIESKHKNIESMETICKLYKQCFNDRFQSSVKLLFLEQFTQIEYLQKKLEKRKETEHLKELLSSYHGDHSGSTMATNLHQQYRNLVIENHQLEQKISKLREQRLRLDSMDQTKVDRIKRLIQNIRFVEILNQSPTSAVDSSPNSTKATSRNNRNHHQDFHSPTLDQMNHSDSYDQSSFSRLSISFDHQLKF